MKITVSLNKNVKDNTFGEDFFFLILKKTSTKDLFGMVL